MKQFTCELEGRSVVLVGSFNPSIFHPAWFEKFGLISREESTNAKIEIVRPELSNFVVGSVSVLVTPDRFQLETPDPASANQLRDIAIGSFRVLDQTPFTQMGVNHHMHFKMDSVELWHKVGHTLVPKAIWSDLIESPGTLRVVVTGKRKGSSAKSVNATVEPSTKVVPGVYVGVNEHFQLAQEQQSQFLIDILNTQWDEIHKFGRFLGDELLKRCLKD
ncbi:MAG: hypothetical protein DMG13_26995 [Acidobacteria bacterium]|nr:MAG: hypothetical protein DMG13_26995 [Acidobacteriota bacterium]